MDRVKDRASGYYSEGYRRDRVQDNGWIESRTEQVDTTVKDIVRTECRITDEQSEERVK